MKQKLALVISGLFVGMALTILTASPAYAKKPVCGNGILEGSEDCDPGVDNPDDCCQADCKFAPTASPCSDGNDCTDDACNAGGVCVSTNDNTNTCTDGNDCTDDVCTNGACVS